MTNPSHYLKKHRASEAKTLSQRQTRKRANVSGCCQCSYAICKSRFHIRGCAGRQENCTELNIAPKELPQPFHVSSSARFHLLYTSRVVLSMTTRQAFT